MRPVRRMVRRKNRRVNLFMLLFICIVIPATAIYVGLRITEKWVSPVLNPEEQDFNFVVDQEKDETIDESEVPSESEEETPVETMEQTTGREAQIKPLSVYAIQIASLGDTSNIDKMINQLNENKLPYLVYQMDNSYKVFVKGATRRNRVEGALEEVKGLYPDAYISELLLPKTVVSINEEKDSEIEALITNLNETIDLMDNQAEEWYNFFEKEGDLNSYSELLKKQQKILGEITNIIGSKSLPSSFSKDDALEKMIHYQESNINRSLELIEENNSENLYKLHSLYLDSLFRIVEVIK